MKRRFFVSAILSVLLIAAQVMTASSSEMEICHRPPGNSMNSHKIWVDENALAAHLEHGDNVVEPEACDGIDNDCDGVIDNGVCSNSGITVASTSKLGSLIIFPKVDTSCVAWDPDTGNCVAYRETSIQIANINANPNAFPAYLNCYWADKEGSVQNFMFNFKSPNQNFRFQASDGSNLLSLVVAPFGLGNSGYLACWVVSEEVSQQISWNYLFGTATVFDPAIDQRYEYNSWNYAAVNTPAGDPVGTPGLIEMDGTKGYDASPAFLRMSFFAKDAEITAWSKISTVGSTDLTLLPCKIDLRENKQPTCTKAKFDVWNERSIKYTGAYTCITNWLAGNLDTITTHPGGPYTPFTNSILHTVTGMFQVLGQGESMEGEPTNKCNDSCSPQQWTPFIGLAVRTEYVNNKAVLSVTIPVGVGYDTFGFIKWEPSTLGFVN
jgi:hypothetical protein